MNIYKDIRHIIFFSLLLIPVSFQSCAPVSVKHSHYPPFTNQEISTILSNLKIQDNAVHSFFSTGRITIQGSDSEFEANVLTLGTRDPFRIKIEITHFWGRPLFHIMIKENRIHIISFPENRYYSGKIGEALTSDLLPVRLDTNQLWALGRGYPILCEYDQAKSFEGNQISLLNKKGTTSQVLEFDAEQDNPLQSSLPEQGLKVSFADFRNNENIRFAKNTQLNDQKTGTMLLLKIKQIVFNKIMDESIFDITIPSGFISY